MLIYHTKNILLWNIKNNKKYKKKTRGSIYHWVMTIPRITYDPSTSLQWQITISQNYEFHQATKQKPAGRSGMHSSLVCKSNEKPKQKTRRKTPSKSQLSGRHFEYFIRPSLHLLCEWHWKGYRNESHRVREGKEGPKGTPSSVCALSLWSIPHARRETDGHF